MRATTQNVVNSKYAAPQKMQPLKSLKTVTYMKDFVNQCDYRAIAGQNIAAPHNKYCGAAISVRLARVFSAQALLLTGEIVPDWDDVCIWSYK